MFNSMGFDNVFSSALSFYSFTHSLSIVNIIVTFVPGNNSGRSKYAYTTKTTFNKNVFFFYTFLFYFSGKMDGMTLILSAAVDFGAVTASTIIFPSIQKIRIFVFSLFSRR